MQRRIRTSLLVSFALTLLAAPEALATNYTLWIHGKNSGGTQAGNYADFSNWGPSSTAAGVNKKAVNWVCSTSVGTHFQALLLAGAPRRIHLWHQGFIRCSSRRSSSASNRAS